jgi:hypothetical protein
MESKLEAWDVWVVVVSTTREMRAREKMFSDLCSNK